MHDFDIEPGVNIGVCPIIGIEGDQNFIGFTTFKLEQAWELLEGADSEECLALNSLFSDVQLLIGPNMTKARLLECLDMIKGIVEEEWLER